jgi:hypothetical protein
MRGAADRALGGLPPSGELELRTIMLVWTGVIVVNVVLQVVAGPPMGVH